MRSVTALLVGCALVACSGSEASPEGGSSSGGSSSGGSSSGGSSSGGSSSGGSSSGGSSSGGSSSGGSSSGDAGSDGSSDGGSCFAPPLPATKAPMITFASAPPTRSYNGIQYAGTYNAYEMRVYSPNATPSTTPDVLKQVVHYDGANVVTFRQEANGKITKQKFDLDAGKTTMTVDPSCS